jgi:hypothetical protein
MADIPGNPDELGLFDDWEPSIWSRYTMNDDDKGSFHDEMSEELDKLHDKSVESSPSSNTNIRIIPFGSGDTTSNIIHRISHNNDTNYGHDKLLESGPDSMDELLDGGLLGPTNASNNNGIGPQGNNSMGISAPRFPSHIDIQSDAGKGPNLWKAMNSQQRMNENIKKDKQSLYNNFELNQLP